MKRATRIGFVKNAIFFMAISGVATVSIIGVASAESLERSESEKINPAHCSNTKQRGQSVNQNCPCCVDVYREVHLFNQYGLLLGTYEEDLQDENCTPLRCDLSCNKPRREAASVQSWVWEDEDGRLYQQ